MARSGPGVTRPESPTGVIERALELGPAIGQHTVQPPAGAAAERNEDTAQDVGGRL
jgi:hypothetical protein